MKLAIIPDFLEENWPSMDLVAEMLLAPAEADTAQIVRPRFKRLTGWPNADRLFNRFVSYPRFLRGHVGSFDCFHICDHSYAQLAHELPAERTGVYCHDLDTFRCLIEPERERRSRWFKAMARRILSGLQRAAVVFYSTQAVREEILTHGLIDATKLVQTPCGVAPEFNASATPAPVPPNIPPNFVLHVGSCIPRKRIDVLIDALAEVRSANLVQVGGTFNSAQLQQIRDRNIPNRVIQLPKQDRVTLAELYRRARAVVVTSESEGFGLPVVEALACGTHVVASNIATLREVGGDVVEYCPVGEAGAFARAIESTGERTSAAARNARIAQAAKFSWQNHARIILDTYRNLMLSSRGQL